MQSKAYAVCPVQASVFIIGKIYFKNKQDFQRNHRQSIPVLFVLKPDLSHSFCAEVLFFITVSCEFFPKCSLAYQKTARKVALGLAARALH